MEWSLRLGLYAHLPRAKQGRRRTACVSRFFKCDILNDPKLFAQQRLSVGDGIDDGIANCYLSTGEVLAITTFAGHVIFVSELILWINHFA